MQVEVRVDGDSEDAWENAKEGLFAAIHLLEALKLLISLTVGNGHKAHVKDAHKLMFIDISEAYLNANVINAELYVELPADMNLPNHCGHLNEALYGQGMRPSAGRTLTRLPFRSKGTTEARPVRACSSMRHLEAACSSLVMTLW